MRNNKTFKSEIIEEKPLTISPRPSPKSTPTLKPKVTEAKEEISETYKIKNVPFTPQAPFAKWDHDHNEACEEAAILIAHYFYKKKDLTPVVSDKEIMGMVNYQKKNWGGHFDLEAKEIAKLAKEYYGYKNVKVSYNVSINDIKKEIAKGNPVILPTAGRLLNNPYYKSPGPLYHALVAIGYTERKIITNDPGTKRGENFSYSYSTIKNALHEWNSGNVYKGKRTMIILVP
ncbi:MAG: C39 family peptidase [Candidatus Pacebacteria bacterium]|nr:C39 family peptidase [Candidatus Paceibacterota bacterium]